ncbi:MAG: peptidoglycan-binding protein [Patescibacteria group bacterium]
MLSARVSKGLGTIITIAALALAATPAYASGSLSVQSLASSNVTVGSQVTFTVVPTGFTSPSYGVYDSFSGSSINAGSFSNGTFSWTPGSGDIGEHDLTITATDAYGGYASVMQTLYVTNQASLTLQSISPASPISVGQTFSFTSGANGFSSPTFTVSDSFSGGTVSAANLSNTGSFSWTPQIQDAGAHTITVTATDGSGHTATASTQVTVGGVPTVIVQGIISPVTITAGSLLSFTVANAGFTTPSYSVMDSFSGTTLTNASLSSTGSFSWTPAVGDIGTHVLTLNVYDASGNTNAASVTVNVVATGTPAVVTTSSASRLSAAQQSAILSLLQSFNVAQSTINTVAAILSGQPVTTAPTVIGDGYVFNNFLHLTSTGTDVTELQNRLISLGLLSGTATGYFGPLTEAAVKQFQSAHGLDQFGYVGPGTRAALNGQ